MNANAQYSTLQQIRQAAEYLIEAKIIVTKATEHEHPPGK
jgi:hypothetical protein